MFFGSISSVLMPQVHSLVLIHPLSREMAGEFERPGLAFWTFFGRVVFVLPPWKLTCWWWRNPKANHPTCMKPCTSRGILTFFQLVHDSFHQQHDSFTLNIWSLFGGRIRSCLCFFCVGGVVTEKHLGFLKYSNVLSRNLQHVIFDSWKDGILFRWFSVFGMLFLSMRNNLIMAVF